LVVLTCGGAAGATLLTLGQALERARAANPALRAAAAAVDAARGRLAQARLLPANPTLGGDAARHTVLAAPRSDNIDRGVELSQEVEVGGQRGLRVQAAEHDVAHAERLLADQQRIVDAAVRRAYAGVVAAVRRLALARESAALAQRLLAIAERRARVGDVGALDVEIARIETSRAEQAAARAVAERTRAAADLAAAIGAEPSEAIEAVDDDVVLGDPPAAEEDLAGRALAARPDLAAAREEQARLEGEADLTHRTGLVPNPTLRVFYRQEAEAEHIAGGGVTIPLPIFNRGQGTEIAERAAAAGAGAEVERLRRDIPRQVHVAFVRRAEASAAWTRYRRDVLPAVEKAGELLERAYAAGYLGLPDVLTQRDRLIAARTEAIAAWLDLAQADADLREAVGGEDGR
jgi:cobalt-zinc-cadmium efflux system outer membrane protein